MSIIRVEQIESKKTKPLWLAWVGEEMPEVLEILKLYQRRFTIEHWYRFAKQRLHWTLPKLGTKEGCDKWSQLMPLMTWQLWLAHQEIIDNPLPWQKPQTQLSPGRTAMAWAEVLLEIGTPTRSPKPRGKSPGWQKGKKRKKKVRCPIVKKGRGVFESKKKAKKLKNSVGFLLKSHQI